MNHRLRRAPIPPPRRPRSEAGVTLVELLVALLISGLFVPLIWVSIRGAIQFFEATIWQVQLERDLDRLTTLLDAEAFDACLFSTTANPAANCVPTAAQACNTAQANQLRFRATLLDGDNAPAGTRVVRYFRTGTDLFRNGPAVLPNGQLDPNAANNQTNQLVMRGVTGFAVTPGNDCTTATIVVRVRPVAPNTFTATQGFGIEIPPRNLGLRTGSRPFVD
jgi:hypothetical protein